MCLYVDRKLSLELGVDFSVCSVMVSASQHTFVTEHVWKSENSYQELLLSMMAVVLNPPNAVTL